MELDFEKQGGLIPAIVQDAQTHKVLMLGYMNREAYEKTLAEGKVTFYSRSKQRLWTKGETSSNFLYVKQLLIDCDQDTILVKATPAGVVCHTGADTCFGETNQGKAAFLNHLQQKIRSKRASRNPNSYTFKLFEEGLNRIVQKVGEEAIELVIEAKDQNADLFKGEAADLLFHFLVLLEAKNTDLDEIIGVLQERER
jgi:phosphoribosyl-AMP cyclohydrolase / phosphoribosyl-ATP pyrophosphohydrolase